MKSFGALLDLVLLCPIGSGARCDRSCWRYGDPEKLERLLQSVHLFSRRINVCWKAIRNRSEWPWPSLAEPHQVTSRIEKGVQFLDEQVLDHLGSTTLRVVR